MAQLIADRFLQLSPGSIVDCATGEPVHLSIEPSGSRTAQQAWSEACANLLTDPLSRLIDFGFIGRDRRFEAASANPRPPLRHAETYVHAMEWLEHASQWSPRILRVEQGAQFLALAREMRLRGFIPVGLSSMGEGDVAAALLPTLSRRSVVLLEPEPSLGDLALGFLKLHSARPRVSFAVVGARALRLARTGVAHAAERRPSFGQSPTYLVLEGAERLVLRGRHEAAERALRAALAACERRNDTLHAGDGALRLGQLLHNRGRTADACELFARARSHYERRGAATQAVLACTFGGLAETDRGLLHEAEDSLRAAYSATCALADTSLQLTTGVALARCLRWQRRHGDASQLLEAITPREGAQDTTRYWCLAARLRLTADDVPGAWGAVSRARLAMGKVDCRPTESLVRTAEAMVQAHLGDVEALEFHVREGLRAAADAHLPLQAIRLRLTLLEGLFRTRETGRARHVASRLRSVSRVALPALLAKRLARALERLTLPSVHESAAVFASAPRLPSNQGDVDGLTELLSHCHGIEDEREALRRAAVTIRKQTGAVGAGIVCVSAPGVGAMLAAAGSVNASVGLRCIAVGQPIGIERCAGGFEAATPIRFLTRIVGAIVCRWSAEGPANADATMAFCSAAAAACAPLTYALRERSAPPASASSEAGCDLIGVSAAIEEVRRAIARAANAPFAVLIEGESGSGKELVARAIHRMGCRRERRFCALNCAAMPEDLVDTELFGHAKGAFTGAGVERLGLFESADQGTVFLDEVGELSPRAQAKLLRVLQEGEIRRIGETFTRAIDARLIAATNRSLHAEVASGRFRQDLLYRLDVIRIGVPPLRERAEDIPLLAVRHWQRAAERIGSKAVLGPGALAALARYDWPGNVRELQNVLTSMVVAVPARGIVSASHMPAAIARAAAPAALETLDMARLHFEQRFVRAALARTAGHRGQTASALGVSRQGLAKLMQRLGIDA
ncbi:MAG: sigma-54 dependent transcriptional regulator [Vicinamibacterales bacterium]|nr:sigma-54 dependent transcriptional regulator [Vicinamibacterales bacterium]